MPAKDRYHDVVKRTLVKDGWTITDEQVKLKIGARRLWIDVKATHPARKTAILIEVKEIDTQSPIDSLANALGKYCLYKAVLKNRHFKIPLYMAVSQQSYDGILSEPIGQQLVQDFEILLLVFDAENEVIVRWIH